MSSSEEGGEIEMCRNVSAIMEGGEVEMCHQ